VIIRETRWVLMVLYNIILNVVAAFPSAVASNSNDDPLSLIVMVSLLFSGGGIVMAFLLPRVIRRLRQRRRKTETHSVSESADKVNGHGHTPLSSPYPHHNSTIESPRSAKNHQRHASLDDSRERAATESRNRPNGLSVSNSQSSLLQLPSVNGGPNYPASQPYSMIVIDENRDTDEMIKIELPLNRFNHRKEEKKGSPERASQEPSVNEEMESDGHPTELNPSAKSTSDSEETPSSSHLLLIPKDYPPERSVLPTPTDWSPNPLQGTEDATPLEDIGEL